MQKNKKIILGLASPFVFILMHVAYGLGMLFFIFKKIVNLETKNKEMSITIKKIKRLGSYSFMNEADLVGVEYKK